MKRTSCIACWVALAAVQAFAAEPSPPAPLARFGDDPRRPIAAAPFANGRFALDDGEVVVFVGQTNLVREQKSGTLEALLAAQFAGRKPRFRNLAWEGDTVVDQWREENFGPLRDQLAWARASIVIAQVGQTEALAGPARIEAFAAAYGKLLEQSAAVTRRIVIVSPIAFEKPLLPHAPDLSQRNADLALYVESIRNLARSRDALFVNLFSPPTATSSGRQRLTENGLHLTPEGERIVARRIVEQLGAASRTEPADALRQAIVEKNRLWFDCWRPMNWAFAYGERATVPFGQGPAGKPSLPDELAHFKPLVARADERIHAIALGEPDPVPTPFPKPQGVPHLPEAAAEAAATAAWDPPDEEQRSFQVLDGYQVNLFASERDGIVKPVQMCWDERGRLWVLCTPTYPHIEPGEKPADYLLICEDTDADGRADKFLRFAEGLMMPMGLELGEGGVYLCESTELVHLADTDGDGRADRRRVLFSGFGTGDSHQLINSLVYGTDGSLWFTQGLSVFSPVETPWGNVRLDRSGVWRLRPRTLRLEPFFNQATAGHNCWGVACDDFGQVFHKSGDRAEGYYTVPGMIRTAHALEYHPTGALFPSHAKTTGFDLIGTRHLGDNLQGAAVLGGFIAGEVELHQIVDDGSGFSSRQLPTLVRSPSAVFRPVDVSVGPDGGIYVADWYNRVIGHYQASYRDPQRDKRHGRIWRVTAKDRPPVKQPGLASMPPDALLDQLRSSERWTRYQAKRLLFNLPSEEVLPAADGWLRRLDPASADFERLLLEVCGVFEAHETVRVELIKQLLSAKDARVRAYGVRALGAWADRSGDAPALDWRETLQLLRERAGDDHPRVRLETVVAASYVGLPEAIEVAAAVLDHPRDRFIDYALTQAVHALKPHWQPALAAGRITFGGRAAHLAFVLAADGTPDVVGHLRSLIASSELSNAARENLLVLLVNVGTADDLRLALERSGNSLAVLAELAAVARIRGAQPAGDLQPLLAPLLDDADPEVRAASIRLAGLWRQTMFAAAFRERAADSAAPLAVRQAALEAVGHLDGRQAIPLLKRHADAAQPFPLRAAAIAALAGLELPAAAELAAAAMAGVGDEARMADLIRPLIERRGGAESLAAAVAQSALPADPARLVSRVLSTAGRGDAALVAALNKAIGVNGQAFEYSPELVAGLARDSHASGDAARGGELYQSKLANCTTCHRIDGAGGGQGPDLSAVGAGLTTELIVESILWPKRQVKEGFQAIVAELDDGRRVQGYKVQETAAELTLRDPATGAELRLAKDQIENLQQGGTIMPDNLSFGMTRQELLDLVRFLSDRGRSGK